MKLIDLEPEFLNYLETQRGCSKNTLRTYRSAFHSLRKATAAVGVPDPDTELVDRRWANRLVQELGRDLRPRTVHRNITAWRSMFQYAVEEGYTTNNPLNGVRLPKKDAVDRTPVTTEDIQRLLSATHLLLDTRRGAMARALLLTAATAATRYSDLMPLRVTDLNLADGLLVIRRGKGNKSRTIPLPRQTVEFLKEWLQVRRAWLNTWPSENSGSPAAGKTGKPREEPDALWLADRGRAFGEDGLRKLLRELCLLAGLNRTIQLHDLRHSAATRMARQGMPLVGIQAVLGHTSLTTTQGYIAGSGPHLRDWAEKMTLPLQEGELERQPDPNNSDEIAQRSSVSRRVRREKESGWENGTWGERWHRGRSSQRGRTRTCSLGTRARSRK